MVWSGQGRRINASPASSHLERLHLPLGQPGWLGQKGGHRQGVTGGKGKGKRGKVKSVVPLEATLLRQCLSGTEKDLFRKHKSYFAHMDDNKAT